MSISLLLVFFGGLWRPASAAEPVRLFFIPENASVVEGDIVKSDIWIDTSGNNINAVDIIVHYDQSVELLSVEKNNSILNLWVAEPAFSDITRTVRFLGGQSAGFNGKGVIGQLFWKSNNAGAKVVLSLDASSAVLLNDGYGTKAEIETRASTHDIGQRGENLPVLATTTHLDENKWYNNPFVRLNWEKAEGTIYSYVVTRDPAGIPDDSADEPVGNIKLVDLDDGVYYFKLKQKRGSENWSGVVSRQIKVDRTPPELLEAKISRDSKLLDNKYFVSFLADDKASGIARYEIIEGDNAPEPVLQPPFILKNQIRAVVVVVRAIDAAGNFKDILIPALPWWQRMASGIWLIIILGALLVIALVVIFVWFKNIPLNKH